MSENIIVPALGESITEATVSKWIKNQGDQVREDEPVVELETDKVNVEVPSPAEGIISKVHFNAGDTVEVGALLGTISSQGDKVTSSGKVVSITKSKERKKKKDAIVEEKDISVLDIGTGTGCILISILSELQNSKGIGIDISQKAIQIANANLKKHKLTQRAKFYKRSLNDIYYNKFDLIVSNPPYIMKKDLKI